MRGFGSRKIKFYVDNISRCLRARLISGTYSGEKWFSADDEDHAIAKCKAWIVKEMSSPMYYVSCYVIDSK